MLALTSLLQVIEQSPDVVIGVGEESGVNLGHPCEQSLLLTVKGNQKRTLQAVEAWFAEHAFAVPTALKPVLDTVDESHGRLTRRRVFLHPAPTELKILEEWPGVQSIMAVESIRRAKPDGGVRAEKRFFLSSLSVEEERQISAIRQHWSIENSLHWVLDVTF
ncbi:MAG: ISAs1 family transposase [Ktedonobacterales bacterium]